MNRIVRTSVPLAAAALLLACSGESTNQKPPTGSTSDGGDTTTSDAGVAVGADAGQTVGDDAGGPTYTWWQDVQPIVEQKCQLCHAEPPQFGAPRPFVQYGDTQGTHPVEQIPLYDLMAARINAPSERMPPPSQTQLSDEERMIITRWAEIGAPEGVPPGDTDGGVMMDPDAGVQPTPDGGQPARTISRTLELVATQPNSTDPYQLPQRTTNYICWSMTVPPGNGNQEYMFRFEPIIDNTRHTHHTLLFKNTGARETDGVPFGCSDTIALNRTMVAGWAPGRTADEIPAGAGVPISPGDQLVLQVHYDSVTTGDQTDQSGVRVMLTDDTNLEEAGMLWCGKIWSSPLNGANAVRTHTWNVSQDVTAFAVFPHLHQLGTRIQLEVQRGGSGPWTHLVDIPAWDFNDQPNVAIPAAEQQLRSGDRLRSTCEWNTQGRSVSFGEASDDEMCFNFVYHYPKINFDYACVGYGP